MQQRIWAIGFPEVSGGKLVLYLAPEASGLLRLFTIIRVANPKDESYDLVKKMCWDLNLVNLLFFTK